MAITAAELRVVVGWDDSAMRSGAQQSESRIAGMGTRLGGIATGLGVAAAASASVVASAISSITVSTMSMQDVLMPVGTLVGTNSVKFADLSESIKDVIKSSPSDPKDVGMAMYQILSAGITDTTKASDALRTSIKLSLAGLGSTEQATSLVTSAMNSFKNENLTAAQAAEIFFGTIQSGKTTTSDLTQGFGQIAPLASMIGIKFSDLMSATAALTGVGNGASTVFAGMRAGLSNILQPTKDANEAARELGVNFSAAHLGAVGLPAFLQEIKDATGGDTEILARFFGSSEAISMFGALMGPANEAFKGNLTTLVASGATLDERAKQVTETMSNRFRTLKNNLLVIGSDLGERVWQKALGWWKDNGPSVMAIVHEFEGGFKALVAAFVSGGSDVTSSGLAGAMERIGLIARNVYDGFKAMFAAFKAGNGDVTSSGFAGTMEKIGNAARTVYDGFKAMFAAFRDGNGDVTSSGFAGTMEKIGNAARSVYNWIKENWPKIKETIGTFINWVASDVVPRAQTYFTLVVNVARDVVDFFVKNWPEIKVVLESVWGVIQSVVELMLATFDMFMKDGKRLWDKFGDEIMSVANFLLEHLGPIFVNLMSFIQGIIGTVTAAIKGDWGKAWESMKDVIKASWDGIVNVVKLGKDALVNLAKAIGPAVAYATIGVWSDLKNGFIDAINWIIEKWNGLEFKIPGTGIGISTPNIPLLGGGPSMTSTNDTWGGGGVMEGVSAYVAPAASMPQSLGTSTGGYGPQSITVNMPSGSSGDDVVRALREYQRRNGAIPISTTGRSR